jgi:hypothetical protein
MARQMIGLLVGAFGLVCAPAALAQAPPCNQEWLRGVHRLADARLSGTNFWSSWRPRR